jgi:hypothetical protein
MLQQVNPAKLKNRVAFQVRQWLSPTLNTHSFSTSPHSTPSLHSRRAASIPLAAKPLSLPLQLPDYGAVDSSQRA